LLGQSYDVFIKPLDLVIAARNTLVQSAAGSKWNSQWTNFGRAPGRCAFCNSCSGRAALNAWLRVYAIQLALDAARKRATVDRFQLVRESKEAIRQYGTKGLWGRQ
jgi:hypothetical protein